MTKPVEKDLNWLKENIEFFINQMENQDKKDLLGNLMYPRVRESCNNTEFVPKITGMLIDLEVLQVTEIIEIIENPEVLRERIDEAIEIIKEEDN
jgi:Poly-adenylate binding protein, unique domain